MEENKGLLLKSAMTYGLYMGIFWVIKYLFFIFSGNVPALYAIYLGFSLAVPFVAYILTKRYRQDLGGNISFFHAWRFGIMLYFFAALLVSLEHFIFFQFVAPPDFIANLMNQTVEMLKNTQIQTEVIESISKIRISPIQMVIQQIFNNVFYGIIFSIPVAALLCRNHVTEYAGGENQEEN